MTLQPILPPKHRKGLAPRVPFAGSLIVFLALLLALPAIADPEREVSARETASAASAPAPARSAPAPSFVPAAPRSAPSSGPSSGYTPSASAPSRAPATSGRGVDRAAPRSGGSRDSASRSGSGNGRTYDRSGPRGPGAGRHHRPRRRYQAPTYGWSGTSWGWGGPWDWWWWGGGWGPPWGFGVTVIEDDAVFPGRYARVDTDVSPEAAEVYLDGIYIGSADDFDGYPGYLYLEPGKYRLEFRHPAYETIVKELEVRRGQGTRLNDEMRLLAGKNRLDATDPERRGTPLGRVFGKPDKDRDERGRDRTGRYESKGRTGPKHEVKVEELDDLDDPDEFDLDDEDAVEEERPPARPEPRAVAPRPHSDDAEPAVRGRLRFDVEPDDAAVYVDDRYVGTAEELAGLRRGFPVKAGKHTVTVVRPGYAAKTMDVEAKPGAAIDVVIELEK